MRGEVRAGQPGRRTNRQTDRLIDRRGDWRTRRAASRTARAAGTPSGAVRARFGERRA